jgi:hypothetical protein
LSSRIDFFASWYPTLPLCKMKITRNYGGESAIAWKKFPKIGPVGCLVPGPNFWVPGIQDTSLGGPSFGDLRRDGDGARRHSRPHAPP